MSTRSIVDPNRTATRLPPVNNRFLDSSSDEEEEDEETRLQREEEEQERLLSEQFGEAEEAPGRKRKSEEDIEAEYSSTTTTRKKTRRRPTLTPSLLTGSKGLVRIGSEFPRQVKWPKNKVNAAALYSRTLVQAYKSFCYDLFPNSAFQDVLTRMESLGSKKIVKDYLQHMRENVRNAHLEKSYGQEKAQAMIQELERGLKQQQDEFEDEEIMNDEVPQYELRRGPVQGPKVNTTTLVGDGGNDDEDPSRNAENTTSPEETCPPSHTSGTISAAAPTTTTTNTSVQQDKAMQDDLQDSDDELEFVISSKPTPVNPFADDDDDDDDDDEEEIDTKTTKDIMHATNIDNKTQQEEEEEEEIVQGDEKETANESTMDSPVQDKTIDTAVELESSKTMTSPIATIDPQVESPVMEESRDTQDMVDEQQDEEMVGVSSPQEEEETMPPSSDETATIMPTMTESQFDDIATQREEEDSQFVATESFLSESQAKINQEQETPSPDNQAPSTAEEEEGSGSFETVAAESQM